LPSAVSLSCERRFWCCSAELHLTTKRISTAFSSSNESPCSNCAPGSHAISEPFSYTARFETRLLHYCTHDCARAESEDRKLFLPVNPRYRLKTVSTDLHAEHNQMPRRTSNRVQNPRSHAPTIESRHQLPRDSHHAQPPQFPCLMLYAAAPCDYPTRSCHRLGLLGDLGV
jgi:hypothetical protein